MRKILVLMLLNSKHEVLLQDYIIAASQTLLSEIKTIELGKR